MNRFERVDLVCGFMKPSKRAKWGPYVTAAAIVFAFILLYIVEVC